MKRKRRFFRVQRLHIFTNDVDYIVAYDPADAIKAWEEWSGDTWDENYDPLDQQLKDTAIITIGCERDDFEEAKKRRPPFSRLGMGKYNPFIAAPAWLWCLWEGRGFLCSTEY